MLWIALALLTAFFNASAATLVKQGLSELRPWEMGMVPTALAGLICLAILPFVEVPPLDAAFWWAWGLSLPLMVVALYFQYSAIQLSPLSLTMPYLSFTPAFVILTGYLLLDEVLNIWGVFGVLFIALAKSAYMLAVKRLNTLISVIYGGLVFQEKNMAIRLSGTLLMLLGVAMIGLLGK